MRMTALWGIAPCSLIRIDRYFRRAYRLNHWAALFIALMMEAARMHHRHPEAVRTPETSVFFSETTWRLSQKAFNFFVTCCNTKGAFLASHRAARATSWSRPTLGSGPTDADRSTWIYDSRWRVQYCRGATKDAGTSECFNEAWVRWRPARARAEWGPPGYLGFKLFVASNEFALFAPWVER
jgi:hypothetical protein